ncbi:uncharacterized protein METZ01_LOCUS207045, partial [marine metagenome]
MNIVTRFFLFHKFSLELYPLLLENHRLFIINSKIFGGKNNEVTQVIKRFISTYFY